MALSLYSVRYIPVRHDREVKAINDKRFLISSFLGRNGYEWVFSTVNAACKVTDGKPFEQLTAGLRATSMLTT